MAKVLDPGQVADKWRKNLVAAKPSIQAGVNAVTVSPTSQAAAKSDKYVAGVQQAVDSGKYQASLQAVSLDDWKSAMLQKGLQRIDSGAQQGQGKMQTFLQSFLPFVQQAAAQVNSMPDMTESDRDQKMLAMVQRLRTYKKPMAPKYS